MKERWLKMLFDDFPKSFNDGNGTCFAGFYQLVANSSPEILDDIRASLRTIGAKEASGLLDRIWMKFPEREIPDDQIERFDLLDRIENEADINVFGLFDEEYGAASEDVLGLLKEFIRKREREVLKSL